MADKYTTWFQGVARVRRVIEYGLHSNDLNHDEVEDELKVVMNDLARAFGMPKPTWEDGE